MRTVFLLPLVILMAAGCQRGESGPAPKPQTRRLAEPAALAESNTPVAQDSRPVILAFGDSLTAGYGVPPGSGYPERLQDILDKRGYKYRVVNAGISGDTTSGGRARLQSALNVKPSIVILELGANDGLRGLPVQAIRENLEEMIDAFQKTGATVVLAAMTLPRNLGTDYVHSFESVFSDVSEKHHISVIPFLLEGVAGIPEFTLQDFMHPNAEGYRLVTDNVLKTLEPLLHK